MQIKMMQLRDPLHRVEPLTKIFDTLFLREHPLKRPSFLGVVGGEAGSGAETYTGTPWGSGRRRTRRDPHINLVLPPSGSSLPTLLW